MRFIVERKFGYLLMTILVLGLIFNIASFSNFVFADSDNEEKKSTKEQKESDRESAKQQREAALFVRLDSVNLAAQVELLKFDLVLHDLPGHFQFHTIKEIG